MIAAVNPGCGRAVFDPSSWSLGTFDIDNSWSVFDHTGAMHGAIARAARTVAPGALDCIALHRSN